MAQIFVSGVAHFFVVVGGSKIHERMAHFFIDIYCEDNGRPSCDPVVLFKLVLIQHLFGIRSLRQTLRNAEVNVAYRWFLGYTMSQRLPHFATVSYAFRNRFTAGTVNLWTC